MIKLTEEQLRNKIAQMVTEALENENFGIENTEFEAKGKRDKDSKIGKHKRKAGKNKRNIVIKWLKDPAVNCAEIMRKLWHPGDQDEEDAMRSYFYKCRDGKLNDDGNPYRFTDEDINSLYSLKSESM